MFKVKNIISIVLIVIVLVFQSCEKNINNVEYPEYTSKLVLHAFISPTDTILKVHVSTTKNIYGKIVNYPKKLSVNVTLIDGDKLVEFGERDSVGYCSLKYQIQAGKEYGIIARCSGYPDASSICKVPEMDNLNIIIDTTTIVVKDNWGEYVDFKTSIKVTDIPNQNNFYNLLGKMHSTTTHLTEGYFMTIETTSDNTYDYKINKLLSDHLLDGQELKAVFINSYLNLSDTLYHAASVEAIVFSTDEGYYKYHKSLEGYKSGDDPFTEFSPIYSNINGGFGIFASYIKYQKTLKLK